MKEKPTTPSRRSIARQATRDEILDTARRQMAEHGAAALSLRAIAREMQVTAPALYRYFKDRDDLVTELIVAAFRSLGDTLFAAHDAYSPADHAKRLLGIALAYRKWALTHPQDYLLIFGTPIPGYHAPEERTAPEAKRAMDVLIDSLKAASQAGALALPATYAKPSATLQTQLNAWKKNYGYTAPAFTLYLALVCWSRIHGLVSLELNNQLQPILSDASELYRAQVVELIQGIGLDLKR